MSRPSNTAILIGRLTKDLVVNYYGEGDRSNAVTRFTLAVDRGRKNADGQTESDFISCVAFGKTAEFMEKYFGRGSKIAVTGEIRTGSYEKDGQKVYTTDINVDKVDFVESRASSQNAQEANYGGQQRQPNNYQQRPANNGYGNPQAFKNQSQQRPPMNGGYNAGFADEFVQIPDSVNSESLPFN